MEAKEYLNQAKKWEEAMKVKSNEIERLKAIAKSPKGMSIDNNPGGKKSTVSDTDRLSHIVIEYVSLEKDLEQEKLKYEHDRKKLIDEILTLEDAKHIQILYKRYIEHKSFTCIANEMGYVHEYISLLHNKALEEFDNKILTNFK